KSKVKLPCIIWISYRKTLSNESQGKINDLKSSGLRICNYQDEPNLSVDKWDIIIVQSGTNAQESENTMRDILKMTQHVLAIDAFANASTLTFLKAYCSENIRVIDNKFQPLVDKTVEYLYDPNSGAEAMRIGYELLQQGKRDELDCVAYTSTVEAGISFEKTNHFDAVIGITNITTPVNVEAFIQMIDLFCPPGYENICVELESARLNNLPTAIRGYREWDKNIVSYKLDQSPAVISYLEVEHQKRFSARNFIEISCSLIASTGASLQLIKMDESRGVIGNHKKICNEVRVEALVIKESDFDAVATSQNLSPEEAEILKFD
ncbi:18364_t:CDS:2, partial [Funneliformis geosporum]